jgi:hypothetical protein
MRSFIRGVGVLAGALFRRASTLPTSRPTSALPSRVREAVERSVDLNLLKIVINITRR